MSFLDKIKARLGKKVGDSMEKAAVPAKEEAPKKAAAPAKEAAPAAPAALSPELAALLPGAPPGGKIKFAHYWGAACGGCDVSMLDIDEKILTVGDMVDIVFWPIAADGKVSDVEALEDGEITLTLFNGAVRNSENEHMAHLLRQKSTIMVAYGSCAMLGGIPGLANTTNTKEILDYVYTKTPTMGAFQKTQKSPVIPQTLYKAPEGDLDLPVLYDTVKALDQVLDVDYYVPGCPPTQKTIAVLLGALIDHVYNGAPLPPKGTVIGAEDKTLCEECPRKKENRRITKVVEPHEIDVDPELCLMDQGIICLGPATRAGCGAPCTQAGQPCRGCYGPTSAVDEQGASMLTALASLFPVLDDDPNMGEDQIIDIMRQVKDPLGYFYQFSMAKSLIRRSVKEKGGK
ncbi:MAG: oxidoreductase [Candidatus Methanomethylophilaceae archaeon]|nr:oxidoreductase [Candidatus Methanomethylophilaceae archaeon]